MFPYTVIHITSCLGVVLVPQWIVVNLISVVDLENTVWISDVGGKRLEIRVNGTWDIVCEVGFTDVDARVRLVHTEGGIDIDKILLQGGICLVLA